MSNPTLFRHYIIAQDAGGTNIEIARSAEQVCVLAFDTQRLCFVHCHIMMDALKNRRSFDERGALLAGRGHPKLARLVECGEDDGNAFYITENVDGETLGAYLARMEKLPLWLAMRIALQTARALEVMLNRGDFLPAVLPDALRLVQTAALNIDVFFSDYRLVETTRSNAAKGRLVKSAFDKQVRFLLDFFNEQKQSAAPGAEASVNAGDFAEVLNTILSSVGPSSLKAIATFCEKLEAEMVQTTEVEIAVQFKPKPLLAAQLATSQEVARSVAQAVRIQSQKLEAAQPFVLRGTFLKTGQNINIEQILPHRLAGSRPSELVRQVLTLQKAGKFPNLVPVIFAQEKDGIECVAEIAVEGVALSDLLNARGVLQPQEVYLVLAGLDTALGQLEKSSVIVRRIRLEDILLFTGFDKKNLRESSLLKSKLNDWPGFSIVLRTYPCLHNVACRGTDPALLLPLNVPPPPGVEPDWHGGWIAALGSFLIGAPLEQTSKLAFPDQQTEAVARLLLDELDKAQRGNPSARSAFLARFVRVLQQQDLANFQGGGLWAELSGSSGAQGHAVEVARNAVVISSPKLLSTEYESEEKSHIGFAELLIGGPSHEEHGALGLHRMGSDRRVQNAPVESSWSTLHQKRPLWKSVFILFVVSIALGAVLATLSGRALWQGRVPVAVEQH